MARSVETRAATVEQAVRQALDQLGSTEDNVTVEILSSGRRGLFSTGRRAHVRVTVKASSTEDQQVPETTVGSGGKMNDASFDQQASIDQQEDRVADANTPIEPDERLEGQAAQRDEPGDGDGSQAEQAAVDWDDPSLTPEQRMAMLDEEAELAADFVEGLLDLFDLPGDIEIEVHEEQALINVQEVGSGLLIGRRGATLDALQELVRCAVQRQTQRRCHVRVDVEGYRERQLDKLREKAREAIAEVRESGEAVRLEPMDAYERKMMHDLVAKTGGVSSSSEGSEPKRRVVIHPES